MNRRTQGLAHERAWELLPWYANGTLELEEEQAVEGHLGGCGECRDELERCRRMGELVRRSAVTPSPHPAQLERLLARVDEEEHGARGSLRRLVEWTPRPVRWAIACQAAVMVVLLALVWPSGPAAFRTLSDPVPRVGERVVAVAPAGARVRIVFAPTATEEEIRRLLLEVRGELVGGPSALGAYTIAVPTAGPGAEALPRVLAHLRGEELVRLAEPVSGER